ncbi:glycoside hydrolase family 2 TIM barrel-domain containing protein [Nocardia goodfellowii]
MIRSSFNHGWEYRTRVNPFSEMSGAAAPYQAVDLPHDALIGQQRTAPEAGVGMDSHANAYFPSGVFEYRKTFFVPEEVAGKRVIFEFEGVYRDATVYINGNYAGQRPYGYSHFHIDADRFLNIGQDNEIRVEARSHRDSRWYTGAGIYRDTWMLIGDLIRIAPDGVRITTPDVDAERAVVDVAVTLTNESTAMRTVDLVTRLHDAAGAVVVEATSKVTVLPGEPVTSRRRCYIREPALWGPESPALYRAELLLRADEDEIDTETATFGIRTLRLDPEHGLRVNDETVTLRGACVHHDNGPLGAATFARAEERRVELLKAAGFNAIRMSHNPMSKAMLDACDRLGMLVVDEAFDMWTSAKSDFDYSLHFPEWWERDIEAMVAKDFNHPCVIMYSIGNEIPEAGSPAGAAMGRKLAEKVRALDSGRFVTNAINNMLAVRSGLAALRERMGSGSGEGAGINTMMTDIGEVMNLISASQMVSEATAESYELLDVAGMNYSESRYKLDRELFPDRVIVGTETFPTRIGHYWPLVRDHQHVIGDFTWTGWDYLGEVGIGRGSYLDAQPPTRSIVGPYPSLVAGCGDIDITGHRRPVSYYREIVFGLRAEPYIAVLRPEHHGKIHVGTPWAWNDVVASWTWPGSDGAPVTVEIYSDAEEVELLLNGDSLGRKPVGEARSYRTEFDTVYRPGELVAVAYRAGAETGRTVLATATGPVHLRAEAERCAVRAAGGDLAYIHLTLTDAEGTICTGLDRPVQVEVSGEGGLQAFGSAAPVTEERFDAAERRTYDGRALAVVRPTGPGKIRLHATASECVPVEIVIDVE